jgi:hypothetical protein
MISVPGAESLLSSYLTCNHGNVTLQFNSHGVLGGSGRSYREA